MRRTVLSALLLSSLILTAAANASPVSDDATASTLRVSTGVTPPQLLNTLTLTYPGAVSSHAIPANSDVTVSFTVNEAGQPQNIRIVKGVDPYWNASIANAVENLRYKPASIDNQAVPMVVNLEISLAR